MGFLRTLFWIVLTIVVVVFSLHNWFAVTINLFGNLQADVKLPVLLLIAFLVGFLPVYAWHRAWRWRERKRRLAAERALSVGIAPSAPPVPQPTTMIDGTAPASAD